MPKSLKIIIPKKVTNVVEFLKGVYGEYKGDLFKPKKIKFTIVKEGFRELSPINNFSELKKHADEISLIMVIPVQNSQPILWIDLSSGFPTIIFEVNYIMGDTEEEMIGIRKRFNEIIEFAKLLMKHTGAEYFYGGSEAFGELGDPANEGLELVYAKSETYIDRISKFVRIETKKELSKEEIEMLIHKVGIIKEEKNGYRLIQFFKLNPKEPPLEHFILTVNEYLEKRKVSGNEKK